MSRKSLIWIGLFVGSTFGSFVPALWGGDIFFSMSSVFFSTLGSIVGIWVAYNASA